MDNRESVASVVQVSKPASTTAPSISGSARVSSSLLASKGSWSGSPNSFSYQWLRCGVRPLSPSSLASPGCLVISSATTSRYSPVSADVGKYLIVRVIAANSRGATTKFSAGTDKVLTASAISTRMLAGASTKIKVTGFKPLSKVRVELHSTPIVLDEITANSSGLFNNEVTVPGDAPAGEHRIVLVGEDALGNSKSSEIPVDVVVPTASTTSLITGKVSNSDGIGLPFVTILASRIDGTANATAQSDSEGNYSILAPKGFNTFTFEWVENSDTQRTASGFGLPTSWRYEISSLPILNSQNLNLTLPHTVAVSVEISNPALSGYVTINPAVSGDSYSSAFELAPGLVGNLYVGTVSGKYASPGSPAVFRFFPIQSARRIFVEGSFFGSGSGNSYRVGKENVDLSSDTTVRIDPTLTTLNLSSSGAPAGANYAYIYSPNFGFELNANSLTEIHIPTGVPLVYELGHQQSSWPSSNAFPDTWRAVSPPITATDPAALQFDLPPASAIHAVMSVNGSSNVLFGTGKTGLRVTQTPSGFIPIGLGADKQAKLLNGLNNNSNVFGSVVAAESYATGSQSLDKKYYFYSGGSLLSGITVTGQGSLDNNTFFFRTVNVDPASLSTGELKDINLDVSTSGNITGGISDASGGVGITTITVSNAANFSKATGESAPNGTIKIPAVLGADAVAIMGLPNIDSSRGLPPVWSILVPTLSVYDIGMFTLPTSTTASIQVLGPLGLPIRDAQITLIGGDTSEPMTLTSSTGVIGKLYDGICPATAVCNLSNRTFETRAVITDKNGIALIRRFGSGALGKVRIEIPGSGPNAATSLVVDCTGPTGSTTPIEIPNRK